MYELHTDRAGRSILYFNKFAIWEGYVSSLDLEGLFQAIRLNVSITKDDPDEDVPF
jgi:hypothetical protein